MAARNAYGGSCAAYLVVRLADRGAFFTTIYRSDIALLNGNIVSSGGDNTPTTSLPLFCRRGIPTPHLRTPLPLPRCRVASKRKNEMKNRKNGRET